MSEAVNAAKRTRRAEKAQETYRRIVEAATRLFLDRGYVPTTIEAIADAADVAVETVYARFRTKANLMVAVKDAAVTEGGGIPLAQRPELAPLAAETDQRRQLQIAAALSRGMLQRVSPVYALLRDAAAADDALREPLAADIDRRRHFQVGPAEVSPLQPRPDEDGLLQVCLAEVGPLQVCREEARPLQTCVGK